MKLWNAAGNEHAQRINVPSDHIIHHATQPECVAVTSDGRWGLSGSKNDFLKTWDMRRAVHVTKAPGSISCLRAAHASGLVVSGSHDGSVRLWDVTDGNCVKTFRGHEAQVTCVEVGYVRGRSLSQPSNNPSVRLLHHPAIRHRSPTNPLICWCIYSLRSLNPSGTRSRVHLYIIRPFRLSVPYIPYILLLWSV